MIDEAFHALEAIDHGKFDTLERGDRWLRALNAIQWAVDAKKGPRLTEAGRKAYAELARSRPGR